MTTPVTWDATVPASYLCLDEDAEERAAELRQDHARTPCGLCNEPILGNPRIGANVMGVVFHVHAGCTGMGWLARLIDLVRAEQAGRGKTDPCGERVGNDWSERLRAALEQREEG